MDIGILKALSSLGGKSLVTMFSSSPALALNYIMQSVMFGLTISSFIVLLLKTIRFSYAKTIVDNRIAKLLIIFLFVYTRVWDEWSAWFIFVGYACAVFMCIYTLDCALNIAEYYTANVRGYYWYQVAAYSIFSMIGPIILIKLFVTSYSYKLLICLIGEIVVIVILNALKNNHIIVSVVPILTMISTVLLRHMSLFNSFTKQIPLYLIPMIMMAFDSEYRQHQHNNKQAIKSKQPVSQSSIIQLLKACVAFLVYVCLNGQSVYVELVLGLIYIILIIAKIK